MNQRADRAEAVAESRSALLIDSLLYFVDELTI